MRASLEELSGQSFLYVSGGHRGQDVLRHVLASSAWRPGLIAVVSDSVPLGAAAECDGVPVVAVPTEHTPDAWWAMAAHGIKGVLAVGVPPDLLEELSQKAFPLGVYGLQAGLLPGTAGPAALNWALIRGLTEKGTSLVRYTKDGYWWLVVSQLPCRIEDVASSITLCANLSTGWSELGTASWTGGYGSRICLSMTVQRFPVTF